MVKKTLLCVLMLGVAAIGSAQITVEFSEVDLPSVTSLSGTDYFAPYGLGFADSTYYAIDTRFIGAGVDDRGITTTSGSSNVMTVVFLRGASSTTVDWVTGDNETITIEAYDPQGGLVDTQSQATPVGTQGQFTLTGRIGWISIHDGTGWVAVGRISYAPLGSVPAMSNLGLALLTALTLLAGLSLLRRLRA